MTTAEKRLRFEKELPTTFAAVIDLIDNGEFREIDRLVNTKELPQYAKDYIVTLLCDELVVLTTESDE